MRIGMFYGPAAGGIRRVVQWLQADRRQRGWETFACDLRRGADALTRAGWTAFRPDVIEAHGWRAGWTARLAARRRGWDAPLVTVAHTYPPGGARAWLWQLLEDRLPARPAVYIAVSPSLGRWLGERVRAQVHVLPLLPPCEFLPREEARRRLGLSAAQRVVGSIGRLTGAKGFDVLLRAWARAVESADPAWRLCIVGDGPDASRLRQLARRLGVAERVVWAGAVPGAGSLVKAFDLYVQPSRSEGAGLAAVEAGRAGVPAILAQVGGLVDMAGREATLVPPEDPEALAAALAERMRWGWQQLQAAGDAFRRGLARRLPADGTLDALATLYQRLASGVPAVARRPDGRGRALGP